MLNDRESPLGPLLGDRRGPSTPRLLRVPRNSRSAQDDNFVVERRFVAQRWLSGVVEIALL
jgi:hypothetical protein